MSAYCCWVNMVGKLMESREGGKDERKLPPTGRPSKLERFWERKVPLEII